MVQYSRKVIVKTDQIFTRRSDFQSKKKEHQDTENYVQKVFV